LLFGLIFSFAPSYIQTHIAWIVGTSVFLCCGCWAISFYHLHHYLDLVRHDDVGLLNLALVAGILAAIACYLIPASDGKPFSDPEFGIEFRGMSFLGLLIVVFILSVRLPEFIASYKRNKDTLKSLFIAKNVFAAIGAAVVFLTALFQFLQILLQLISGSTEVSGYTIPRKLSD
jgi:hypothetical protein